MAGGRANTARATDLTGCSRPIVRGVPPRARAPSGPGHIPGTHHQRGARAGGPGSPGPPYEAPPTACLAGDGWSPHGVCCPLPPFLLPWRSARVCPAHGGPVCGAAHVAARLGGRAQYAVRNRTVPCPVSWLFIRGCSSIELEPYEHITSMKVLSLLSDEQLSGRRVRLRERVHVCVEAGGRARLSRTAYCVQSYVVVGTTRVFGEEVSARGKVRACVRAGPPTPRGRGVFFVLFLKRPSLSAR